MATIPLVKARILEIAAQLEALDSTEAKADHIIKSLVQPEPSTFIERLTDEHKALQTKLQALRLFMMTTLFRELDRREQTLMEQQSRQMTGYLSTLAMRLDIYGVYA